MDRWTRGGSLDHAARAGARWRELLDRYERPPLDEAIEAELVEYVERRAAELGDEVDVRR
jgi:trimethylamine--corrinoid protein Co-methyltransferase